MDGRKQRTARRSNHAVRLEQKLTGSSTEVGSRPWASSLTLSLNQECELFSLLLLRDSNLFFVVVHDFGERVAVTTSLGQVTDDRDAVVAVKEIFRTAS